MTAVWKAENPAATPDDAAAELARLLGQHDRLDEEYVQSFSWIASAVAGTGRTIGGLAGLVREVVAGRPAPEEEAEEELVQRGEGPYAHLLPREELPAGTPAWKARLARRYPVERLSCGAEAASVMERALEALLSCGAEAASVMERALEALEAVETLVSECVEEAEQAGQAAMAKLAAAERWAEAVDAFEARTAPAGGAGDAMDEGRMADGAFGTE